MQGECDSINEKKEETLKAAEKLLAVHGLSMRDETEAEAILHGAPQGKLVFTITVLWSEKTVSTIFTLSTKNPFDNTRSRV